MSRQVMRGELARFIELSAAERAQLRWERERKGWTRETLAEIVGYHPVTVRYWENGTKSPKPQSYIDWLDALR